MVLLLSALLLLHPSSALAHDCQVIQAADVPGSAVIAAISRRLTAKEGVEQRSILRRPVPSAAAFRGWQVDKDYAGDFVDPFRLEPAPFDCVDENLYPTHPQMTLK